LAAHFRIGIKDERGLNQSLFASATPASFDLQRVAFQANGEFLYRSDRMTASFGLGIDRSEGFDTVLSPRLGANFRVLQNTRIRASWGQGFNLPSFYALAEPVVGNPNLKPEYSNAFDAGIEHVFRKPKLRVSASYFHNWFRDLIDFSAQQFQLVNRTQAQTQGEEFEAVLPINRGIEVGSNLSLLRWHLNRTTEPLRNQAPWRAGAYVDWRINSRVHTRIDSLFLGRRYDFQIPVPQIQSVGGYSTTDLAFSYKVGHGLATYLRIDNLFNSGYHDFIGFPNPGIYARVGLTYRISGH
jgi:vitamin B12 transporter